MFQSQVSRKIRTRVVGKLSGTGKAPGSGNVIDRPTASLQLREVNTRWGQPYAPVVLSYG